MRALEAIDYPPVWLLGFVALAWGLSTVSAVFGDALLWPGRILVGLGLALALWAAWGFRRARTTIVPREAPSALVETGPYRFSRNPIYLADLMILAGVAMSLGTALGLLLVVPFKWVLERRFIRPEEAMLADRLGADYEAYRSRVRRWL